MDTGMSCIISIGYGYTYVNVHVHMPTLKCLTKNNFPGV